MTFETYEPTPAPRRPRAAVRFGVAFLVGLIAALALGAGALYAYDQQYTGKILPGVRVGNIELAGLTREQAVERVADEYHSVGEGAIQLNTPDGPLQVPYELIERHVDADALVDAALGVVVTCGMGGPVTAPQPRSRGTSTTRRLGSSPIDWVATLGWSRSVRWTQRRSRAGIGSSCSILPVSTTRAAAR